MENYLERLKDIWGSDINDSKAALEWIKKTVDCKIEEDLYLEFKQKSESRDSLANDDDRANLAKAISGFSNTDGGLIIWGVRAKHKKKGRARRRRTENVNLS